MEKFYVIKPECGFYKQVFDYLENAQIVNKLFNQFSHDMEIESNLLKIRRIASLFSAASFTKY